MKIFFLKKIVLITLCIFCSGCIGYSISPVYRSIFRYDEKVLGYTVKVLSAGGTPFSISCNVAMQDEELPELDFARQLAVNLYLQILEKLNSDWSGVRDRDHYSSMDFKFFVHFSKKGVPFPPPFDSGKIEKVMFKKNMVYYFESTKLSTLHEESIAEAVKCLEKRGEILSPKYVKWLEIDENISK